MTDLPPGWTETTLGEIADTSLGKMLDRGKATGKNVVPYLRNVNVQWGHIDLEDVLSMEIPPEEQDFFRLEPGDLLVCEGGEVGRCAIWQGNANYMAYQKALHRVRPCAGVEVKYLRYLLEHMSLSEMLVPYSTGSTIKHLPQQKLRRLPIRLAPTVEQGRIIAVLDEQLSHLDSAQKRVEVAQHRLVNLRRSLIRKRFSELRSDSRSIRHLGEVAEIVSGQTPKGLADVLQRDPSSDSVPYYKVGDMNLAVDCYMSGSRTHILRNDAAVLRLHIRPAGTVLIPKRGGAIHTNKKRISKTLAACDLNIMGIIPSGALDSKFLWYWLEGINLSDLCDGSNIPQINNPHLVNLEIPVPPLEGQAEVVSELDARTAAIQPFADAGLAAKSRRLRRSLLEEAFSGRLVEQDPADEPASLLLASIQARRAAQGPVRRPRRGKGEKVRQKETLL